MRFAVAGVVTFAVAGAVSHALADGISVPLSRVTIASNSLGAPVETISQSGMIAVTAGNTSSLTVQNLAAGTPPTIFGSPGLPVLGGLPGDTWHPPLVPFFTDDGNLIGASSTGTGASAIYYGQPGSFHTVARSGGTYGAGYTFGNLGVPRVSRAGQLVFCDTVNDNGVAIVASSQGAAPTRVAAVNDIAPNTPGARFAGFSPPSINGTGRIVFTADLQVGVGGTTTTNQQIMYMAISGGPIALLMRENDVMSNGHHLDNFVDAPGINNAGQVVARVRFKESAGDDALLTSDGSGSPGSVHILAETGVHGPGMTGDEVWMGNEPVFSRPAINHSGQIAFVGATFKSSTSSFGWGVWRGTTASNLELLVHSGQAAPGFDPGVTITSMGGPVNMNAGGDILFGAAIQGPGINSSNNTVLYAYTPDAGLIPLIRKGMTLPTGTSTTGQVSYFSLNQDGSGGEDGQPLNLNDRREFVAEIGFTNGLVGVYIGTIPAPASLLLFGGAALTMRRKRSAN